MDRKELEGRLAPCGLDCARCVRKKDGEVARLAAELAGKLEGYAAFAARLAAMNPALAGYPQFEAMLGFLAGADCGGCRADNRCGMPGCAAKVCAAERGIPFCGECAEFPATATPTPAARPPVKAWDADRRSARRVLRGAGARPRY
jgi:hypothetical protein